MKTTILLGLLSGALSASALTVDAELPAGNVVFESEKAIFDTDIGADIVDRGRFYRTFGETVR